MYLFLITRGLPGLYYFITTADSNMVSISILFATQCYYPSRLVCSDDAEESCIKQYIDVVLQQARGSRRVTFDLALHNINKAL
jgi:hypothetical protein